MVLLKIDSKNAYFKHTKTMNSKNWTKIITPCNSLTELPTTIDFDVALRELGSAQSDNNNNKITIHNNSERGNKMDKKPRLNTQHSVNIVNTPHECEKLLTADCGFLWILIHSIRFMTHCSIPNISLWTWVYSILYSSLRSTQFCAPFVLFFYYLYSLASFIFHTKPLTWLVCLISSIE